MNFENKYWYFNSALPNHFCDKLIKYASSKNEQLGITGGFGKEGGRDDSPLTNDEINNLKKRRDSNIVWLSEHWLYRYIHYFVHLANRNAGWNFQWDYSEAAQFTKYKLNQEPTLNINDNGEPRLQPATGLATFLSGKHFIEPNG